MTMQKQKPAMKLKNDFGTKQKLVDQLMSKLTKPKEESSDAFKKRLLKVSSSKLLKLQERVSTPSK